jgi:hypothetical protein
MTKENPSLADCLAELADLHREGVLSEAELLSATDRLLAQSSTRTEESESTEGTPDATSTPGSAISTGRQEQPPVPRPSTSTNPVPSGDPPVPSRKAPKRRRRLVAAMVALTLLLVAAIGIQIIFGSPRAKEVVETRPTSAVISPNLTQDPSASASAPSVSVWAFSLSGWAKLGRREFIEPGSSTLRSWESDAFVLLMAHGRQESSAPKR